MKCEDCIHYKSIGTLCDKYIYPEERNNEPCKHFENNDGTYSNGTWHCPRCGVPVSKWGLCMDCEILYITPERRIVPVNLKIEKIYKHKSDFSDIDDDIEDEEIEDSWESVSK